MDGPFDIVGFGVATHDVLMEVEVFPPSGGKARILSREDLCGGLTATALVAASRLGARCWYGGALGANDVSEQVRGILRGYGVKMAVNSPYSAGVEPISAMVYVERESGERTILWSEFLTPAPILNGEAIEIALSAKCIFADHFFAEELSPLYCQARAKGIPIVGDFESSNFPGVAKALAFIDHPIFPASFVHEYLGHDDIPLAVLQLLREHDRSTVVITDGDKGAWFAGEGCETVHHQPAFSVPVCDTTGCGDVFHGAYAAMLAFGMTLPERVRFAAAAAALKATKKGGQAGAPTRCELEIFLTNQ